MRSLVLRAAAVPVVLLCLLMLTVPAWGAGNFTYIDPPELKALIDQKTPGLLVIDSRGASQYEEARIPGAISLPLGTMEENASLPAAPKSALLVFYCSGNT